MRRTLLFLSYVLHIALSFTTSDYMIPMRDGIKLYTVAMYHDRPSPTVMIRTPYSTGSLTTEGAFWATVGFNAILQDFRGRYNSQGTFNFWSNASSDAYDTMEWLTSQQWSNGKVFTTGVSANGIAEYLQPILSPPWIKAQYVSWATAQMHETIFQGGAFRQSLIEGWLDSIQESEFLYLVIDNEALGPYWYPEEMTGHWENIDFPAVHLTGWYDIFNQHQLDAFQQYQQNSSDPGTNFLVIGPGGHCQLPIWPNGTLDSKIGFDITFTMFKALSESDDRTFLKQSLANLSTVYFYIMGPGTPNSLGNFWYLADTYPPFQTKSINLFLSQEGSLSLQPSPEPSQSLSYIYNPANPVSTIGGNNLIIPCGPLNQTSLYNRQDIISFVTEELYENILVCGQMEAVLYVSSNATDTDFTVKIVDSFPDNVTNTLIQDSIIRMRWRDSPSVPTLMTPGVVYEVKINLWSTCYYFNAGHKLRVDISSSNSPRFFANPNNGLMLNQDGPLVIAENTIHFDRNYQSRVIVPVVN